MTYILRELEWFDLAGWRAHLEELRALPASASRDMQVKSAQRHIDEIMPFFDSPQKIAAERP